ncbi:ABC transporter permease [Kitasatospora sp. NPDC050463]|uniref:ABC transporter permease n=1 Tax=Kitasatospora sp. NPDC050463 TaxID=3155786 RepID=UPI0033E7D879
MGAKFAVTGGREGWIRTLLTALGVGLAVALLLFTTAVPAAKEALSERESNRSTYLSTDKAAEDTLLVADTHSTYKGENVFGRMVRAEGSRPVLPPGLARLPGPGEMVVSPALAALLDSPEGKRLLEPRLPYKRVATIAEPGLRGPAELAYYAGSDVMKAGDGFVVRIAGFGNPEPQEPWDPVLLLLILITCVVLLLPVAVFIAAAVRFGGERRDRRLAALRLVGADAATVRRIAAGEALSGAVFGVLVGAVLFAVGREFVAAFPISETRMYPVDIAVSPALALLVVFAVPVASVAVTLFAMRGVVIEPLGVVRTSKPPRRRLWWRLAMPLAGLALLYPMMGQSKREQFNQWQVSGGVVLLLVGVTALLPWLVEVAVNRLGAGSVSWQLAVRRLQLASGVAVRPVNGIAVAVAGAIALHALFTGIESSYATDTGIDTDRAQLQVLTPSQVEPSRMPGITAQIASTEGVRKAISLGSAGVGEKARNPESYRSVTVGDCASLREVAVLDTCAEGEAFLLPDAEQPQEVSKPGREVVIDPSSDAGVRGAEIVWTVPMDIKTVASRPDPTGFTRAGLIATPGALPAEVLDILRYSTFVTIDPSVADAEEHVRNTVARAHPLMMPMSLKAVQVNGRFAAVKKGLLIGSAAVLLLIGASLFVAQVEQLRERRKLLAALVAFGTRRRTLSLSVLWQTAVPIVLGLVLACGAGLALGAVLLQMVSRPVHFDWTSVAVMTGVGGAVVLLVTALSLPPLWRMTRPEGIRTE